HFIIQADTASGRKPHGRYSLPCASRPAAARLDLGVRAHMQPIAILLIAAGALVTPFYFHALVRFWRILLEERPDLANRRGSLSFFYTGLPRIGDPNVSMAVIGAAFGPV